MEEKVGLVLFLGLKQLEFQRAVLKYVQKKTHGDNEDDDGEDEAAKQEMEDENEEITPDALAAVVVNPRGIAAAVQCAQERAKQKVSSLKANAKTAQNAGESAYSVEIDINDYPQDARSKVTTKENIQRFISLSGASVTMRGRYYPPGKKPGPNDEPRLHLVHLY